MQITTVGLDLAKNVFQVHAINSAGDVVVKKTLRRVQMRRFCCMTQRLEPLCGSRCSPKPTYSSVGPPYPRPGCWRPARPEPSAGSGASAELLGIARPPSKPS